MTKFKLGQKVKHINWGLGVVVGDNGDSTSAIVKFENYIEDWGTDTLEVSEGCMCDAKNLF